MKNSFQEQVNTYNVFPLLLIPDVCIAGLGFIMFLDGENKHKKLIFGRFVIQFEA